MVQFVVMRDFWMTWNNIDVSFYILGESHAVVLNSKEFAYTELLTCSSPPLSQNLIIHQQRLGENNGYQYSDEHIAIQFELERIDGEYQSGSETMAYLESSYPEIGYSSTPYTRISWKCDRYQLTLDTVHTYPNDDCHVISRTIFTLLSEMENQRAAN